MKTHLNLLPWQFRCRLLARSRVRQWSVVWGISFLITVGVCALTHLQLEAGRRELQVQHDTSSPLKSLQTQNEQIRARLDQLHSHQSLLVLLEQTQQPLWLIGLVSRHARNGGGRLQVQNFSLKQLQPALRSGTEGIDSHNLAQLTLKGIAVDDLAVARFIVGLRDSGIFDSVELKSSIRTQVENISAREYSVECTF